MKHQFKMNYPDYQYNPPSFTPWQPVNKSHCEKCGLLLEGIMGYVCTNTDCPTGLGPVICNYEWVCNTN